MIWHALLNVCDLRENRITRLASSASMTGYDMINSFKESQKYFSWCTNRSVWASQLTCLAAHLHKSMYTYEVTKACTHTHTQTLPHSGLQWRMRCHALRNALFWSSSFSPTEVYPISPFSPLHNATSSAHLSAAALNGRHTNTDSHYNVLEFMETCTWHTKPHTHGNALKSFPSLSDASFLFLCPSFIVSMRFLTLQLRCCTWAQDNKTWYIKNELLQCRSKQIRSDYPVFPFATVHNRMTRCTPQTHQNKIYFKEKHI